MDHFLERYSLDTATFHRLLKDSSALFSGSAALALYLEQEGVRAGYEPNDIDLWIPSEAWRGEWNEPWIHFLIHSGYHVTHNHVEQDQYMESLNRIQQVLTFQREAKKIQIIVLGLEGSEPIQHYVANYFDLSVCMTWWCHESERFYTIYPALTLQKKMFVRSHGEVLALHGGGRSEQRIQKYVDRGFVRVDAPPPFCVKPDERARMDVAVWEGVKAFDVWEYEEVDAADHLCQSEWKILLGCGDSWWAFDRKALITYMEGRRMINDEVGTVYDTPYRQTVTHEGWDLLAYSDYSVYRLVDGQEHMVHGAPKTVYAMEAYSVEGWRRGIVGDRAGNEIEVLVMIDGAQPEEAEAEREAEPDDVLALLSDELGIDLSAYSSSSSSSSSIHMTLAEAAFYEELREVMNWIGQEGDESL
jgi:hypothetical protein